MIDKLTLYLNEQNELIRLNRDEIERDNYAFVSVAVKIGLVCYAALFALSLLGIPGLNGHSEESLIGFFVTGGVAILCKIASSRLSSLCTAYALYAALFAFSVYNSLVGEPETACMLAPMIVALAPILLIDKSVRISCVMAVSTLFYTGLVMLAKDQQYASVEIANCCVALIVGVVLGGMVRQSRIVSCDLRRLVRQHGLVDELTGLRSRGELFQAFSRLEMCGDGFEDVGVVLIDLDYFKECNDTFGHRRGDECLRRVGDCLKRVGLPYDVRFYRFGGEEFVGVMETGARDGIVSLAEAVHREVAALGIPRTLDGSAHLTASVGVALGVSGTKQGEQLVWQADAALYEAKKAGRNCVVVYERGMTIGDIDL